MSISEEIREFLVTRRGRLTPEDAGLPVYGRNRRVTGLRREEVALLAGISVEYYTRLERGKVGNVSESVLEGLASALNIDAAEREHLYDLIRTASGSSQHAPRTGRTTPTSQIRPALQRALDALSIPAYIRNNRFDLLASNQQGRLLYGPIFDATPPGQVPNLARFLFLRPESQDFFPEFQRSCDDAVAFLRSEAGRNPQDAAFNQLIGELSTQSEDFRRRWAAHNVRFHLSGPKRLQHPLFGKLELDYEAFEIPGDPGLRMNMYLAPPDTPTEQALNLLGSWATRSAEELPIRPA